MVLGRLWHLQDCQLLPGCWPERVYPETTLERLPVVAAPEPRLAVVLTVAFATWLEDAGIPTRVIDLMGHAGGRRGGGAHPREGSLIGNRYRWTTPEMGGRVVAAIEQRLATSLAVAVRAVNLGRSEQAEAAKDANL